MNYLGLVGTLQPKTPEHTFFSSTHGIKINNVLGHKENLNTFQRISVKQSLFSDHNAYS